MPIWSSRLQPRVRLIRAPSQASRRRRRGSVSDRVSGQERGRAPSRRAHLLAVQAHLLAVRAPAVAVAPGLPTALPQR